MFCSGSSRTVLATRPELMPCSEHSKRRLSNRSGAFAARLRRVRSHAGEPDDLSANARSDYRRQKLKARSSNSGVRWCIHVPAYLSRSGGILAERALSPATALLESLTERLTGCRIRSHAVAIRRHLSSSPQGSPQTNSGYRRDDGKPLYCLIF